MDYVLAIGISKMPKIPDKSNFHFFLNKVFRKIFQLGNLILLYENQKPIYYRANIKKNRVY